jgi:hypothetical protein
MLFLADSLFNIPGLHWELVVPIAIGVSVSGLALAVGRVFLGKRRRAASRSGGEATAENFDPFVEGSKSERRSSVRRRGNPVAILIGDDKGERELGRGWVVDRSMGGLCLSCDIPLESAQVVTVKPVSAPGSVFWTQVEVRSCRHADDAYEVGCRFVKTPSWNQLLYFG